MELRTKFNKVLPSQLAYLFVLIWLLNSCNIEKKELQIIFNSNRNGNDDIFIMNRDGSGLENLSKNEAGDYYPAYSPTNGKILFYSNRDGNNEIYSMNIDGTNQIRLTNNKAYDAYGSWSPDGKRIVYNSNQDGNYDLHVMDANGENDINITQSKSVDRQPTWSPDGLKIAYFSIRSKETFGIYTISPDGTNKTKLTSGLDTHPRWSPDGELIIFDRKVDGINHIYSMSKDGKDIQLIEKTPGFKHASYLKDDTIVMSLSSEKAGEENIYIKNLRSGALSKITADSQRNIHPEPVRY